MTLSEKWPLQEAHQAQPPPINSHWGAVSARCPLPAPFGRPYSGIAALLSIRPLPCLWLRAPEALQFRWTALQQGWGGPRGLQACPVNNDPENKTEDACEGNGQTNK